MGTGFVYKCKNCGFSRMHQYGIGMMFTPENFNISPLKDKNSIWWTFGLEDFNIKLIDDLLVNKKGKYVGGGYTDFYSPKYKIRQNAFDFKIEYEENGKKNV